VSNSVFRTSMALNCPTRDRPHNNYQLDSGTGFICCRVLVIRASRKSRIKRDESLFERIATWIESKQIESASARWYRGFVSGSHMDHASIRHWAVGVFVGLTHLHVERPRTIRRGSSTRIWGQGACRERGDPESKQVQLRFCIAAPPGFQSNPSTRQELRLSTVHVTYGRGV
jgi:hypothetical protein